jgi:hypothetical protein
MGWPALGLALATLRFFLHHWYTRPVHLHIQNGNRLTDDDGQIQLDGLADFALLAFGDVGANGFRCTLHRFGGHFQAGQNLHLLAAVIEGRCMANDSLHAAHRGRAVAVCDIEVAIDGELCGLKHKLAGFKA